MGYLSQSQRVRLLYKTILRLHRGLPKDLQDVGTKYAREEFKRHRNCSPKEAEIFLSEWSTYAVTLAEQLGIRGPKSGTNRFGQSLTIDDLQHFRKEQIVQLYELMMAANPSAETDKK